MYRKQNMMTTSSIQILDINEPYMLYSFNITAEMFYGLNFPICYVYQIHHPPFDRTASTKRLT